jgi:hypothetical protein
VLFFFCAQTILGTVAGLVFCLRLSWRLSMLSVAILGPLSMITSLYSNWASDLWARVWGIQVAKEQQSFCLLFRCVFEGFDQ